MREIKFKAIDEKSGEWVFGDLIHGVGPKQGNIYILPIKHNLAYIKNCDPLDGVAVLSETVCQFTGLKDRKGVEIYEYDEIVITTEIDISRRFGECIMKKQSITAYVSWSQKICGFDLVTIRPDDFLKHYDMYSLRLDDTDFWVTGNIRHNQT